MIVPNNITQMQRGAIIIVNVKTNIPKTKNPCKQNNDTFTLGKIIMK